MPIFDAPARPGMLRPITPDMKAAVEALVGRFRTAFPQLDFEIAWRSDTVNARALRGTGRRRICLYGGMARHKMIGEDGLALTLAHEIGHVLGGRPRHPYHFWLSCEGVADYWATRHGLRRIWPRAECAARLRNGARQLLNLQRSGFVKTAAYRRRREAGGRFPCLVSLPPSCRMRTWRAGLQGRPMPDCAC